MRIKKLVAGILASFLLISLVGCGKSEDKGKDGGKTPEIKKDTKSKEEKNNYPFELTTYTFSQKEVKETIKEEPKKVVLDGANNFRLMNKLGLNDKVVALIEPDDQAKKDFPNAKVLDWKGSKEPVLALNPDLLLGWYGLFYKDALGEVDFWHKKGVNTYMSLNSGARKDGKLTVSNIDGELDDIINIGKIFNKNDEAKKIADEVKGEITKVTDFVAKEKKSKVKVAILESNEKGFRVYGKDSLAGDMATKLGGELVVGQEGGGQIGQENLISADPDVIMLVTYDSLGTPTEVVKKFMEDEKLKSLKAVKNKKVFGVELSYIYTSGLNTKDGLLAFAKAFYPDLYEK